MKKNTPKISKNCFYPHALEMVNFLVISTLVILLSPFTANALTSGNYTYTVSQNEATITRVNAHISGVVKVPSKLGGTTVTHIGPNAFNGCQRLTSVKLPNSITTIEKGAFCGCERLKSITLPANLKSIGKGAFYNCSGLKSVTFPDGLTQIGFRAFAGCSNLTSITIPASVKNMGDEMFKWCDGLKELYFLGNAPILGRKVFSGVHSNATVYKKVGTTGWDETFGGLPVKNWNTHTEHETIASF